MPFKALQITGSPEKPEIQETIVDVFSHTPRTFSIQERQVQQWGKLIRHVYHPQRGRNGYGPVPALWLDWIELEGPLKEPATAFQHILSQHSNGSEDERAHGILHDFAKLALRVDKPHQTFIQQLLKHYENQRKAGKSFNIALRQPLSIILASPDFLYFNEPGHEDKSRSLTQRELAIRLAYFLWSSAPDQELLTLAQKNQLKSPQQLEQQIKRLISDPRSRKFVSGFVHQWLDMDRLDFFQFDVKLHREFDDNTRKLAREEVYQSFSHLMKGHDGGKLSHLLKSDYVIINDLLATYYGIEGVEGDHFRKVNLAHNSPRGGLLGMAAIHAMGSNGTESSPVERGTWVLRHLLNEPPPPAPPNVPQLSRLSDKPLTTRERLLAHQEQPQCASCHRKIDPHWFRPRKL